MKAKPAPDGAHDTSASATPANAQVPEKGTSDSGASACGEVRAAGSRAGELGEKEKTSEQTKGAISAADTLAALGGQRSSNPKAGSGGPSCGPPLVSAGLCVGEAGDAGLNSTDLQGQGLGFSAPSTALEGPLCGASGSRTEEVATPARSPSARSEAPSLTDFAEALTMRGPTEKEALVTAGAAPAKGKRAAAEAAEGSGEGQQGWEGDVGRRTRPLRRAAAAGNTSRRQQPDGEGMEQQQPLTLRAPEGPRVVSRLPGVKYCHSRNAWIARWSEEGQERWKTFSIKACKGFTEARIQAVQFRWEKVRMKYAKLMKQATPQPGLIGSSQADGAAQTEALEMDAEAAELAAALQMYGNGSQVRIPRPKNNANGGPRQGRSQSPSDPFRGPTAGETPNGRTTRQKRQGGAYGGARLAIEKGDLQVAGNGHNAKRPCPTSANQQQQQQQGVHQQLTASQWALLQQHLQMQANRADGSSTTKPTLDEWPEEDKAGTSLPGAPQRASSSAQRAGGAPPPVKADPGRGPLTELAGSEGDLKTQLFLQVAKKLQQSSKQQDAALMLQGLKALLASRQDQLLPPRLPPQQQQQPLLANDCNNADLETELLRLLASSTGLMGNRGDRASSLNLPGLQQGGLSPQVLSALGNKDLSSTQPWSESVGEKGLTDSVQTLTRLLGDASRSSSSGAADAAADAAARSGPLGLPQWPVNSVLASTRASEAQIGGGSPWATGGASSSVVRELFDGGGVAEEGMDLQPWRRAVCVILEDVLENCILEVGSQQRQGSTLSQERLQFAPMVGRLKALAARSCSKAELRPFLRLFARSIRLGLVPSKQSEDVQQLILDALGALDYALATSRSTQPQPTLTRGPLDAEAPSPFTVLPAGGTFT